MLLLERDGNVCRACPTPHMLNSMDEIRVDHIDNSPNHHCLRNLRLVCHQRNVRKGLAHCCHLISYPELDTKWITAPLEIRQLPSSQAYVCVDTDVDLNNPEPVQAGAGVPPPVISRRERQALDDVKDAPTLTATMRKNRRTEPAFNAWLDEQVGSGACYTFEEYANAGAHLFECSQETTKRYLDKRLNPVTGDLFLAKRSDVDNDTRLYVFFRKHVLDDVEK